MLVESSKGRAPSRPVIASLIGIVVVIWAVNFIAAKIGLQSFPPLTMASFRVCAAGLVMVPFYLCLKRLRLSAFAEAESVRKQDLHGAMLGHFFTWAFLALV